MLAVAFILSAPLSVFADAVPLVENTDFMHARYYSPNLGRFISVDPVGGSIGSSQSWNRYSYVLNNPVGNLDPDGEEVVAATLGGIGATVSAPVVAGVAVGGGLGYGLFVAPVYAGNGQTAFEWWGEAIGGLFNENTSESGDDEVIIDDSTKTEDWTDQAVDDYDGTEESADEIDKRLRNEETMKDAQRKRHQRERQFENDELEGDPDEVLRPVRPGQKPREVPKIPESD
jgi:RHS repeat-associated protein